MGMNTFRYEPQERPLSPAIYWRRRFLALVAGLAILAAVGWAVSGVLPASPNGATHSGTASGGSSGTGTSPSPVQTSAFASGLPRRCPASDIVISVFSSRSSYRRAQSPEFDVDVVSTARRTCAFNVGPKFLSLVVMAGRKRVWSSADCVQGRGSLMTNLARGVPTVLPITWDRRRSAPGCTATSGQVRSGSFAAFASDGSAASNSVTFRLR
jgi:hypothetical protein